MVVGNVSSTVRLDGGIDRIDNELANRVSKFPGAITSGFIKIESAAGR